MATIDDVDILVGLLEFSSHLDLLFFEYEVPCDEATTMALALNRCVELAGILSW
jgi:hypothetical protein